jgi:hypothetical protein
MLFFSAKILDIFIFNAIRTVFLLVFGLSVFIATTAGAASFTNNGDGTVTDNSTGLMWQQGESSAMTWEATLSYCEGLTLGNHPAWRLPNIKELESLTDDTRYNPSIDTTLFPNAHASAYWSSTTHASSTYYEWYVYFGSGYVSSSFWSNSRYVRCVRGGQ